MSNEKTEVLLRSRDNSVYWEKPLPSVFKEDLSEEAYTVIMELDRRFIQLWDKVVFEGRNKG